MIPRTSRSPVHKTLARLSGCSGSESRARARGSTYTGSALVPASGCWAWTCRTTGRWSGISDADVGLHAVTDAILGALGRGDIGEHFAPGDPRWRGADSAQFVSYANELVREAAAQVMHVDVTVICEAPAVAPHRDRMRETLAGLLGVPSATVSVKATTTDGLGFLGRREGIAAFALATLAMPPESA